MKARTTFSPTATWRCSASTPEARNRLAPARNLQHLTPENAQAFGATLLRVHVTRIVSRTYHAELHIASRDGSVVVDARPSDSIALALRFNAPIFASDDLLTAALLEESETMSEPEQDAEFRPMSPEELKAYLENLRPEDIVKFRL